MVEEKKEETKEEPKPSSAEASKGKEEKVEVPKKFKKLIEDIESLSVLELAELVKVLEEKFGVSAQAPMVAAPVQEGDGESGGSAPEKSVFNIELKEIGEKKIEVIKVVRDITQKGLKEAKDLVDAAVSSPQVIKENVKKEEAEELKKKLEEAGAKIELL